jgi:hypothetical protein
VKRPPSIVVLVPLRGPATALVLAENAEDQERVRRAIVDRPDLVAEIVFALGGLLEALDAAAEGDEAA